MRITKKKVAAISAGAALVLAGGGIALAYWTTTGTGSGSATTGSSSPFEVTLAAPVGYPLSPGGPTDHVAFTVKNNGGGYQKVNTADTVAVATGDGSAWTAVSGCSAADYSITNVSLTATNLAPGGTVDGSFDIQMIDTGANQNLCKGATVPLYVHVS
ncbi:MAG TPA: hypothetical protein VGL39_18970 [Jatrophihabitantaceae bacterium]|jgi:hypothetical protein